MAYRVVSWEQVLVQGDGAENATSPWAEGEAVADAVSAVRADVSALSSRFPGTQMDVIDVPAGADWDSPARTEAEVLRRAGSAALAAALSRVSRDALLLLLVPHAQFNQDFLNRVRMNTISGEQWYLPVAFSRHAQYAHPRFLTPTGVKPQVNTGRFNLRLASVLAFYRADYDAAVSEWARGSSADAGAAELLAHSELRCVRAPDPGLVLEPRAPPCLTGEHAPPDEHCAKELRATGLGALDLGAKQALAQLLLETQAELED